MRTASLSTFTRSSAAERDTQHRSTLVSSFIMHTASHTAAAPLDRKEWKVIVLGVPSSPMDENSRPVRARAPLRLGLAGGGSDLSPFCDEYGGFILNASIPLFVYAIIQRRSDGKVCFVGADRQESLIYDATLDFPMDGGLSLHKAAYKRIMCDFNRGEPLPVTLTTYSDVPAGSGLGSSSTLVVAMIEAFKEALSLPLGEYEVAQLAHRVERVDAGMPGGKQDQYAATFGGFNFMEFYGDNRVIVN